MSKRFLFIHSGTDLYGSDRMLLFVLEIVRTQFPDSYTEVWIPGPGALSRKISDDFPEVLVRFEPTSILRRYDLKRLNFSALFRLMLFPRWISRFSKFDVIVVNTIVIWDALLALRFVKSRKVVYVHEAPEGGARKIFRWFIRQADAEQVFVSRAAQESVGDSGNERQRVIWNGRPALQVAPPSPNTTSATLHLLLLGRISTVKGQEVLIDAMALLPEDLRRLIEVRIVGDVFGKQPMLLSNLHQKIEQHRLEQQVTFHPFSASPEAHFSWADGVVVPSVFPEPFGLVAIEAMSAFRPVIASAHGGLLEIVDDGITGWLFPPGDALALSKLLVKAATMDREAFLSLGLAGRYKFEAYFSEEHCRRAWIDLLQEDLNSTY